MKFVTTLGYISTVSDWAYDNAFILLETNKIIHYMKRYALKSIFAIEIGFIEYLFQDEDEDENLASYFAPYLLTYEYKIQPTLISIYDIQIINFNDY